MTQQAIVVQSRQTITPRDITQGFIRESAMVNWSKADVRSFGFAMLQWNFALCKKVYAGRRTRQFQIDKIKNIWKLFLRQSRQKQPSVF
ncbi:hypothetical protein FGO68_gene11433 [Halteria grandinella]|uniref:Uncharacterized protein n=1 Tax=Halteria grandinella TaxID=5974 RepID=A0A8J8STJ3_HALGN|nr:hypothetical protein FGO68_gene11433 [Halteria grandinella]